MMIRKIVILLLASMLIITGNIVYAESYPEYTEITSPIQYKGDKAYIDFGNGKAYTSDIVYAGGRVAVPVEESVKALGGSFKDDVFGLHVTIGDKTALINRAGKLDRRIVTFTYDNKEYVSLYELLEPFDLVPVVNIKYQRIDIVANTTNKRVEADSTAEKAYIRLEDIVADGLDTNTEPNYTVENIEKLRYTAQYLYENGADYYVAFIPRYVNGATDYSNDLLNDFNLYNAYFLYVLDYMADHGGHIGAHGYTHQYGKDVSAVGYEWGAATPYSYNEQVQRFILARQTVEALGYRCEFFEFPHYGATDAQLRMAEQYFPIIYQQFNAPNLLNILTYTQRSGKKVYYLPTPAEYVKHRGDRDGILERLQKCLTQKYTMSLYYHPAVDVNYMTVDTVSGKRVWSYTEAGVLPAVADFIKTHGYRFVSLG
jgi:hypothetical protein